MKLVPKLSKLLAVLVITCFFMAGYPKRDAPESVSLSSSNHPSEVYFLRENKGQLPDHVLYRYHGGSKLLYLERDGFLWHVLHPEDLKDNGGCRHGSSCNHRHHNRNVIRQHVYKINFVGANKNFKKEGIGASPYYVNYFRGKDESKWATEVRDYLATKWYNVYDGIDLHFYHNDEGMKYDWIVHPGADPKNIVLDYQHLNDLYIKKGKLYQVNGIDTIIESAPFTYQIINGKKIEIKSSYTLKGNTLVGLKIGRYNEKYDLIIDPTLVFSTYTGATSDNWGSTATPGSDGSFYAGGIAMDQGYPRVSGFFDSTYDPSNRPLTGLIPDIAISKFTPDGSNIIYSTYLGGSEGEFVHSIIENSRGELVILGTTSSSNFPATGRAFQRNFAGGTQIGTNATNGLEFFNGSDIIVTVLNQNGTDLVGSTFLGGSANDGINNRDQLAVNYGDQFRGEVIVDEQDNIYVASCTQSNNFPVSSNAAFGNKSSDQDACVFSLNRDCSTLRFSTFLGGASAEAAYSLKRNSSGNIILTGGTSSTNFPTRNALSGTYNGGSTDGFLCIFNNNLSDLISSTFVGTSDYDQSYFVSLDFDDQIYIAGQSRGDIGISPDVYNVPNSGQFIHIYEPDISARRQATRFGTGSGEIDISLTALNVDECKRIFLSGWGGTVNASNLDGVGNPKVPFSTTRGLQVTPDAFRSSTDGSDFYFIALESDFRSLLFATFFGHNNVNGEPVSDDHVDGGTSRFAEDGSIYQAVCATCGNSNNFPTSPNAHSRVNGASTIGRCNLAAVKFDFELDEIDAAVDLVLDTFGCAPYNAEFINLSRGADSYFWSFGDGDTSTERSPNHQYDSIGIYPVRMIARSSFDCLDPDTVDINIRIIASEPPILDTIRECDRDFVILQSSRGEPNSRYIWEDGTTTSRGRRVLETGVYSVSATESNCVYIDSFWVTIINPEVDLEDSIICGFFPFEIDLDPRARDINWSTGSRERSILIDETGLYSVNYYIDSCYFEDTAFYSFASIPDISIVGDSVICGETPLELRAENSSKSTISNYSWSTGANGPSIEVLEPGTYTVTARSDSNCVDMATINVIRIEELPELIAGDSLICRESELVVDFSEFAGFSEIVWSDGRRDAVRTFTTPGTYSYTISNFCETRNGTVNLEVSPFSADEQPIYIPNAFTPNEDNTNDIFKPEIANEITILSYRMMVFDRWGNKVFESRNVDLGWDGTFKGEIMDPAIFAYTFEIEYFLCESPRSIVLNGDVNLQK